MFTFSLDDICRAKTIPVEIKDIEGNVEGVVYLKEPDAPATMKLREKLNKQTDSSEASSQEEFIFDVLTLTLSNADGSSLVNTSVDREKLKTMPVRVLFALQDTAMKMVLGGSRQEVRVDSEDIDTTLANLDDQVAATYSATYRGEPELSAAGAESVVGVPIEGNENLHLDQDPGDSSSTTADPTNPFEVPAEVPSLPV